MPRFNIPYLQILGPDGELINSVPELAAELSQPEQLLSLYSQMLLARLFDKKAISLQRTGRLGTYPSTLGQEAIFVGLGYAMSADDVLVPYYRDAAAQLMRGVAMEEILWYWGGNEQGSNFAAKSASRDFPICVPIATQCLHAAGVAAAIQYQKKSGVAVTTIGDGGTSKGDFYEALNVAGIWNLPFVAVINNNQWAISVPRQKQTLSATLAQKGFAAGLHCVQVDGNDILGMIVTMQAALQRARQGEGATLIEAITYRLSDHTTADDASRYRDAAEVAAAQHLDPLKRFRTYLLAKGILSLELEEQLTSELEQKIEQAVARYLAQPKQNLGSMFDYLYAELPEDLRQQRDEVLSFAAQELLTEEEDNV